MQESTEAVSWKLCRDPRPRSCTGSEQDAAVKKKEKKKKKKLKSVYLTKH